MGRIDNFMWRLDRTIGFELATLILLLVAAVLLAVNCVVTFGWWF